MKKISTSIILIILIFPIIIHAETITYDVCESGCEYESMYAVERAINSAQNLEGNDIVININIDFNGGFYIDQSNISEVNSVTINGNNHNHDVISIPANNVIINNLNLTTGYFVCLTKLVINNSNINTLMIGTDRDRFNNKEASLNEILEIDAESLNNIKIFVFSGNINIENMNFSNKPIENLGGTLNIYNSEIFKLINFPMDGYPVNNIYNSKFNTLKYKSFSSENEFFNEFSGLNEDSDYNSLQYDIYDINVPESEFKSNTTVYFDKELEIKIDDKINLTEYLDYYTTDKEIDYVIEDESIAKIENKELVGLKEGQNNVTVTTDDGHVVYRIKLNVLKKTIAEKIDEMTVKVPITGTKIKVWILVVAVLLFGVIGVIIYLLIKNKKSK